ncbi:ComEA family DNA-binding protein [uncultured Shewanella sp.]|uniref:ComEA family DNA-binding protein n=1 Tax=uncultured Shewanella sp. TaxID=173975 RepID=UPI0026182540|nr:ComEA family DNA-binding protein [uncultured Shewanella sp.]
MKFSLCSLLFALLFVGNVYAGSASTSDTNPVTRDTSTVQTAQVQPDKINVNTASVSELASLKGVGSVKAQAIKQYQQSHGDFSSLADLEKVNGIGASVIEQNKDRIEF